MVRATDRAQHRARRCPAYSAIAGAERHWPADTHMDVARAVPRNRAVAPCAGAFRGEKQRSAPYSAQVAAQLFSRSPSALVVQLGARRLLQRFHHLEHPPRWRENFPAPANCAWPTMRPMHVITCNESMAHHSLSERACCNMLMFKVRTMGLQVRLKSA